MSRRTASSRSGSTVDMEVSNLFKLQNKNQFTNAANRQFGSGWAWLVVDKNGKLQVTNTPNQDNPLMPKAIVSGTPILALDVWEHAYYLQYQSKRKNYIDAFFNIINWTVVGEKYEEALKKE